MTWAALGWAAYLVGGGRLRESMHWRVVYSEKVQVVSVPKLSGQKGLKLENQKLVAVAFGSYFWLNLGCLSIVILGRSWASGSEQVSRGAQAS